MINKYEVKRMRDEGKTLEEIGNEVGCSYVTIHNILKNTPSEKS